LFPATDDFESLPVSSEIQSEDWAIYRLFAALIFGALLVMDEQTISS
jgi:hypothetical protein